MLRTIATALTIMAAVVATPHRVQCQQTGVDPVIVSPEKFKVLLANDHVRVIEYVLGPGERDDWHTHPPKVSYVISGGALRITLADSSSFESEEKTGTAVWMTALPRHFAQNVGRTPVRIVLVEPKGSDFRPASRDQDPAFVNPTSIDVKLENDSVRVMVATLPPGFKEKLHTHPGYVMYILDGGSVRLHSADGGMRDSRFEAGAVFYSEPITHWAENTGTTTIRVLLVELR